MNAIWNAFVIQRTCESWKDASLSENSHILLTLSLFWDWVFMHENFNHARHVISQTAAHVYSSAGGLMFSESNHQLSLFTTYRLPRDWSHTNKYCLCLRGLKVKLLQLGAHSALWRAMQQGALKKYNSFDSCILKHITCLYINKQHILYCSSIISS